MGMMEDKQLSLLVWCKHDSSADPSGTANIRVVRVDTGEEVPLKDGSYLVRVSMESATPITRCFIRHIGSGREVYFQSGQELPNFARTCLVQDNIARSDLPETTEVVSKPEVSVEAEVQDELRNDGNAS